MGTAFVSPLRYPGGKGVLAPYLGQLVADQTPVCSTFVEPFAGGAGAALRLLYGEYVERLVLNDLDAGICALWRSIFQQTDEFIDLIETCDLSVDEWQVHRSVYVDPAAATDLELGFATFYLNRTNRSGILRARPIGGMEQGGRWKIDARFNRDELASRVRRLGRYRNRVEISSEDAVDFIERHLSGLASGEVFAYVDPPYIEKSRGLYLDTMRWPDHERLARMLSRATGQWVLTYDHDSRVANDLYPDFRCVGFDIAHTAARQYVGSEYAVFSNELELRTFDGLRVDPELGDTLLTTNG